ncbi:MAG: DUF167 domain-containing protein [Alphaproteobacteria bacterium]|nr:DUF167 domain-containing protein [Alphaproteobacteria bacterium]MBN2674902.1 DUF167 domain-containing protein [Alphaproteobacteria bacterium]
MNINIRVIPKAKLNKITAKTDGDLKVHTTTAPTDGKANDSVIKQLADYFKVPKSKIKIIRGANSRDKVITF